MQNTKVIGVRFPKDTLDKIDQTVTRLQKRNKDVEFNRNKIIVQAVQDALLQANRIIK
jgi:metal-responsive CopG/Arc/MetJ family transcriptional regulator